MELSKEVLSMIKLYYKNNFKPWREDRFAIACSGGYDSMVAVDFFVKGNYKPVLLHVNHSTGNDKAQMLVESIADKHGLKIIVYNVDPSHKKSKESWEEFWRNERLNFFSKFEGPVITGHNLDDAMETWIFSSINGQSKLIPYNTNNIYRSFILNRKSTLKNYAINRNIAWEEDLSNNDVAYARNRIRHNIIPEVMAINKGFDTLLTKMYLKEKNL